MRSASPGPVQVTARGIGRLRVFFDPELLDYGRPVTVSINGKSRGRLKLERSPEILLREVHHTGDTARLYWDSRDFDVPR